VACKTAETEPHKVLRNCLPRISKVSSRVIFYGKLSRELFWVVANKTAAAVPHKVLRNRLPRISKVSSLKSRL